MMKRILAWLLLLAMAVGACSIPARLARADLFGGDVAVLAQILVQTIRQLAELQSIVGSSAQTVSILEDMNRGVSEVLRLANTAHVSLPKQVYDQARTITDAAKMAESLYGPMSNHAQRSTRNEYSSGVEGLYLSEDAFDYSLTLDGTAERVKSSAVLANQAAATRLSAETLGVVVEAVSHGNRLQAKNLEISSTERLENSAKANANYESFLETHDVLANDLKNQNVSPLNSFGAPSQSEGAK